MTKTTAEFKSSLVQYLLVNMPVLIGLNLQEADQYVLHKRNQFYLPKWYPE